MAAGRKSSVAHTTVAVVSALCLLSTPVSAAKVSITNLEDVRFGTIDPSVDARIAQDVCAFSDNKTASYSVTALGAGPGFRFNLTAGPGLPGLPYEVEWNDQPGMQTGTSLMPGVASGGFTENAQNKHCQQGSFETASLIVVLRSAALSTAVNNVFYVGTLIITIAPE